MDNFDALIDVVANKVPTDDNTYVGDDGLRYCKACNGPRQCRIDVPVRGTRVVNCVCPCLAAKIDQAEEERKQIERMDQISKYRSLGFCVDDEEIRKAKVENDDMMHPDITTMIKGYLQHFDAMEEKAQGLLFYGPVGTGKSFYAGCIFNGVIDKCKPALMTNFPRLVNEINDRFEGKQARIDRLTQYSLVVIDDLGIERDSGFVHETVQVIVDTLIKANIPLIITTNFTPQELTNEKDIRLKRVYDRILGKCRPIPVMGESRRKAQRKASWDWMDEIIGI